MTGKTIRIYLPEGSPSGVLVAEIINWTGRVLVVPRTRLANLADRPEVGRTGVYCLAGPDPDSTNRERVYIGEADNVRNRLLAHDRDEKKEFWTRAVVITSKDENLTKAHGRFLESRLIELTGVAKRATLDNGTAPPPLPESDTADMEFFIAQLQLLLPVVGLYFLRPTAAVSRPGVGLASPTFVINWVGTSARAQVIDGEIVVLKGSTARKEGARSWTSYRALREQLVEEGQLVDSDDPGYFVFAEDVAFSSPSSSASVVMARAANGRVEWTIEGTGQSLRDWQESHPGLASNTHTDDGS